MTELQAGIAKQNRGEKMNLAGLWGPFWEAIGPYLTTASLAAVLVWIGGRFIDARMKSRFDRVMEDYKAELRTRDQAAKIAEYIALARNLKDTDSEELYRRCNQLAWEMFLWLPADVFRKLGKGLAGGDPNELANVLIAVRNILNEKGGTLGVESMIFHHPNIGRQKKP